MLMWAMSDRAIPRSYRTMQGFGVHTFRLVNAAGESHVREVPLDADGRHAFAGVGRGGEDLRRRSRLPSPRSVGGDRGGRLSRSGSWACRSSPRNRPRRFTFDVLDATKIVPEELVPIVPVGKLVLNRNPGQLLRRDRAGGVLHRARRARHRLHQRSAAGRPHPLVRRHADLAARRSELPRDPDQRADRAGAQQPARRHASAGDQSRPGRRTSRIRSAAAVRSRPARAGFVSFPEPQRAEAITRCAARPSASPITTRRRRCSGTARRDVEKHAHRQRLPLRAVAGADAGGPRADGVGPDERRAGAGRGGGGRARASASCRRRCRRCCTTEVTPEVTASPALSLFARPGDGSIRTRRVAILVADGCRRRAASTRSPSG